MRACRPVASFLLGAWILVAGTVAGALDAESISRIVGVSAATTADGAVRVSWPRTDVSVRIDGMAFRPQMGLGTWAAFQATPAGARVMGDSVVFEDEVNPAIDAALASGLEITALHNHFFFDDPKVYFMHVGGTGSIEELAAGVRNIWDAVKRVRAEHSVPARVFSNETPRYGELDTQRVEETIGAEGKLENGVFKITLGRDATMQGVPFGASMGLTTWMAFAGSDDLAAVAGDFAMTADEVQPVLRALRGAGIHIVALHNHMLGEAPAYYFTHFWGKGPAASLAEGLHMALEAQRTVASAGNLRAGPSVLTLGFDSMPAGAAPPGFSVARTGRGAPGAWVVRKDESAPSGSMVLAQTSSDATNHRFPVCVYDGFGATDVDLSVHFRPLSGEVDQAAGLVWRYQDADNYYVVRANALEDNVVLYKVEDGKRSDLKPTDAWPFAYGKDAPVPTGSWSVLRVVASGHRFSVWLNGEHLFDVLDATFQGPGRVGLWTKADSVTLFDSLAIRGS